MTRRRAKPTSFLTLDEVVAIHAHQVRRYGGGAGIRDSVLLQSALGMPEATFDGQLVHETPFEQAAAHLFHLARSHAFVDGNKRVALACALTFLRLNGWTVDADEDDVVGLVVAVASGSAAKADVASWLKQRAERLRDGSGRREST